MAGMSGLELIGKLRERNIAAPAILIISQPSAALSAWATNARVPIVEKPLFGNALLDRINELLRPPRARLKTKFAVVDLNQNGSVASLYGAYASRRF